VFIKVTGDHVLNSPFSVRFHAGAASAATTTASGEGLIGGLVGDQLAFLLIERDRFENYRTLGGNQANMIVSYSGVAATALTTQSPLDMAVSLTLSLSHALTLSLSHSPKS